MKKLIALVEVVAFLASAAPAFANGDADIYISVKNDGTTVKNYVTTTSDTGGNASIGGGASTSVSGGNVKNSDDNNTAGNGGGNSSTGGNGGKVKTGDAISTSLVLNDVNSTDIKVKTSCECDDGKIKIKVRNEDTYVKNKVTTTADTGWNSSVGGGATTDVSGGNVKNSDDNNTAGNGGGNSSTGGDGSKVKTGNADSLSSVVNVVNSTTVRVRRI